MGTPASAGGAVRSGMYRTYIDLFLVKLYDMACDDRLIVTHLVEVAYHDHVRS